MTDNHEQKVYTHRPNTKVLPGFLLNQRNKYKLYCSQVEFVKYGYKLTTQHREWFEESERLTKESQPI